MKHSTKILAFMLVSILAFSSLFGCSWVQSYMNSVLNGENSGTVEQAEKTPVSDRNESAEQRNDIIETETPTPVPEEPTPTPTPVPEEPTPTPTPAEPTPTPTPVETPLPSSFLFGGVEVMAGQTAVKVTGKKNAIIRITPEEMDMLIRLCPNLTSMELVYCCMADYSRIGELTKLKHLLISTTTHSQDYGIPLVDIDWIASLKNLRYLSLTYNKIDDIRAIAKLTDLEELNLGWNELSDDDLDWLTDLNLQSLFLYCNSKLRDVSALAKIKSLQLLHIGGNKKLSGIKSLAKLPNLKTLDISYCPNDGFLWMKDFKKLETLRIYKTEYLDFYDYYDLMQCESLRKVVISKDDKQIESALRGLISDFRPDIEIQYWEDYTGD